MPPLPHGTQMLPPLARPDLPAGSEPLHEVPERVLDLLPIPLCRWDLPAAPLPEAPAEAFVEALLREGRIGYLNPAAATLFGAPRRESLVGVRLGALPATAARPEPLLARRFLAGRGRLADSTIRLPGPAGEVVLCRAGWEGVRDGGALRAIWVVLRPEAPPAATGGAGPLTAPAPPAPCPELVGCSAAMCRVQEKIAQVAPTDSTVLIRGETGTGKELIARAIHRASARRDRPLVAVNCGAIARGVVESELFGHEKGAFTGALTRKIGYVELADGGTLFLDEIGDLPLDLQVKLLRVLQEGEVIRVGATQPVRVNVRVVAATHRDLASMVQRGEFRQDLFYRLNVFPIPVAPLRERTEDIPDLARHFVALYAGRLGKEIDAIPMAVLDRLRQFPWPGNIRELANVIERSVITTPGSTLVLAEWATGQHVPVSPAPVGLPPAAQGPTTLHAVDREHIVRVLEASGWRVSGPGGAAERLGLKPTTLEARMKKLGISRPGRGEAGQP
ncbi:MAG: sigma 54-interacting transcriptional regulator [Gemmatimonadales bacterium]|nr:sigma 54-interacting transcriptional regulator [Gemmatimonadales bacterium]